MEPFVDEAVARQVRFGMQGCSGSRSLALCLADERNNNSHCRVMAAGAAAGRWRAWGVEDAAERGLCMHTHCMHTHCPCHCPLHTRAYYTRRLPWSTSEGERGVPAGGPLVPAGVQGAGSA
jgi:hypothetical protein